MRWGAVAAGQPPAGGKSAEHKGMAPLRKEDLTIGEEIGKGRFKSVVRGVLRCGASVRRDIVVLQYVKSGEKRELQVLAMIANHPASSSFVPEIFGAIDEGRKVLVVQERALRGSVKAAITDASMAASLTARHRVFASAGLARAMAFLESNRIVHADLSCRNILLCGFDEGDASETVVKVTDFGLAVVLREGADSEVRKQPQATRWSAPETVAHCKFSHRSDVWSTGMTLWELFSDGEVPWARWQKRNNVGARLRALAEAADKGSDDDVAEDFPAPGDCGPATHAAILSCLRVDELARPGFAQLVEDFQRIAGDPKEFPELACPEEEEEEEEEADQQEGDGAEAACDTSAMPSEVEQSSDASGETTREGRKAGAPGGTRTPSTSATPTVPWWHTEHADVPTDLFAGPKAAAFAEALRDFLHSERVKDVLGEKAGLEALKEFLCSPHALELLTSEARHSGFVDYVRRRTPKMALREALPALEACLASRARRFSAPPQLAVVGMPVSDTLVPLSPNGVPADYAQPLAQHGCFWTLLSLVSTALLRRREFVEQADAWAAFNACGTSACMLRDPRGNDVASQSWVVVSTQPALGISTQAAVTWLGHVAQPLHAAVF